MSNSDVRNCQRTPANNTSSDAATILEAVAQELKLTGEQLCAERGSPERSALKFRAAWLMRKAGLSWPVIARALRYARPCTAIHAFKRWEQVRAGGAPLVLQSEARIIDEVAEKYGVASDEIRSGAEIDKRTLAKYEAAWRMRQAKFSWGAIARALGYARGHAAARACRRHEELRAAEAPSVKDIGAGPEGVLVHAFDHWAAQACSGSREGRDRSCTLQSDFPAGSSSGLGPRAHTPVIASSNLAPATICEASR